MPTKQVTKSRYQTRNDDKVFSEEERAAVAATARERKSAAGRSPAQERADGEADLRESLAKMPADDRAMGERIHEIVGEPPSIYRQGHGPIVAPHCVQLAAMRPRMAAGETAQSSSFGEAISASVP